MSDGRIFQVIRAVTENFRTLILVLDHGTSWSPWSDDHRVRVGHIWVQHVMKIDWLLMLQCIVA